MYDKLSMVWARFWSFSWKWI